MVNSNSTYRLYTISKKVSEEMNKKDSRTRESIAAALEIDFINLRNDVVKVKCYLLRTMR